jgi:hypothetical protein
VVVVKGFEANLLASQQNAFCFHALAEVRRGRRESRKICRSSAKEVLSLQSRQLKNGM